MSRYVTREQLAAWMLELDDAVKDAMHPECSRSELVERLRVLRAAIDAAWLDMTREEVRNTP